MNLWNYALVGVLVLFGMADAVAQVRVKGYTRKDGTYVAPHYRSSPNSSKYDNYSTKGNYNPYTGEKGSVDPYRQAYAPSSYPLPAPAYSPPLPTAPSYPPPTSARTRATFWSSPSPASPAMSSAYTSDQGLEAVRALARRLQASDPYWEIRYAQLSTQLASIGKAYPPSQWAEETERAYWNIPASKASRRPPNSSTLLAQYGAPSSYACDAAEDAREALENAATNLAQCASQRDYSDDCSSEASDAHDAADNYESAISTANGQCY